MKIKMRLVSVLWDSGGNETGRMTIKKIGCRGGLQTCDGSNDVLGGGEID